jgi:hypothetical protein
VKGEGGKGVARVQVENSSGAHGKRQKQNKISVRLCDVFRPTFLRDEKG